MRTTLVCLFLSFSALLAEPTVEWKEKRVLVTGVDQSKDIKIVVAGGTEQELQLRPGILGEWKPTGKQSFEFVPNYPFPPGGKYVVLIGKHHAYFAVPDDRDRTPAELKQIYPSGDKIPENILRFYIVFSKPMSRGEAYARVKILDDNNKPVDQPFLEIDEELWDSEQKRLTLLIDPGRIKQEVKPRLDLGPVFQAGKRYTLVVDGRWKDANGNEIGKETRKSLTATPPETKAPSPKDWTIDAPKKASDPVRIQFPITMDEALLGNSLSVRGVEGKVTVRNHETIWEFQPKTQWQAGDYEIVLDWKLEDVSGNAIDRPFESEETPVAPRKPLTNTSAIQFKVSFTSN